jgi:hypothetical protein
MVQSVGTEIVPHLLKAPVCYGKYFPLFKMLGATDEISIKQYCRVLEIIKNKAKGSQFIPEEMKISEKAIIGVLDCLKNEHTLMIDESFCGRILCGNFINNSSGLRAFLSFFNMVKSNIKSISV